MKAVTMPIAMMTVIHIARNSNGQADQGGSS